MADVASRCEFSAVSQLNGMERTWHCRPSAVKDIANKGQPQPLPVMPSQNLRRLNSDVRSEELSHQMAFDSQERCAEAYKETALVELAIPPLSRSIGWPMPALRAIVGRPRARRWFTRRQPLRYTRPDKEESSDARCALRTPTGFSPKRTMGLNLQDKGKQECEWRFAPHTFAPPVCQDL